MEPAQPAEPPLKKQAVLAPCDNPDWKDGGRFMWAVCESVVMEWAMGDPVMWVDNRDARLPESSAQTSSSHSDIHGF